MRELTEKETKQKEFIEKKLAEYGIKIDGKYKFKNPFHLYFGQPAPIKITSAVIGLTPLTDQEGVVLFILCYQDEKLFRGINFVPTDVNYSKTRSFNKKKIFWADYSLSDFDKFISVTEGIELDKEYYKKMISKAEEVISACNIYLKD